MNIIPIEHNSQRVLTTAQLAESFGTDRIIIANNFNRNKERYTEGKHYVALHGNEKNEFIDRNQIDDGSKKASLLYLWTEKGAWLHAKSLNTDKAWEAYEMLVDDYYAVKQHLIDHSLLSPEMQMFKHVFDGVAKMQIEAAETKRELQNVQTAVATIQETIIQRNDDNWRDEINARLNKISKRSGKFKEIRTESYQLLEDRGRCDLGKRVRFLKDRLEESGATKTKIEAVSKLDVIESDPRLKEIYASIVKELAIKYGRDLEPSDRVTFESSNYSDGQALTIVAVGFVLIYLIAKGGLFA